MSAPRNERLVIRREDSGRYSVMLGGVELSGLIAADGLKIEWLDDEWSMGHPTITMTFASDALELDLDATLIAYLDRKAEAS